MCVPWVALQARRLVQERIASSRDVERLSQDVHCVGSLLGAVSSNRPQTDSVAVGALCARVVDLCRDVRSKPLSEAVSQVGTPSFDCVCVGGGG